MKRLRALLLACILVSASGFAWADATVYVVHGIPGVPADVYVDGDRVLSDLQFSTITAPLTLPAGSYDLMVFAAGDDPATGSALIRVPGALLNDDESVSLVAHLAEDGTPTLTPYVNDLKPGRPFRSRLVVRHAAQAPELEVAVNRRTGFTLSNGEGDQAEVVARPQMITLTAASGRVPMFGPTLVKPEPGTLLVIYAVGMLEPPTDPLGDRPFLANPGDPVQGRPSWQPFRWRDASAVAGNASDSTFALLVQVLPLRP